MLLLLLSLVWQRRWLMWLLLLILLLLLLAVLRLRCAKCGRCIERIHCGCGRVQRRKRLLRRVVSCRLSHETHHLGTTSFHVDVEHH